MKETNCQMFERQKVHRDIPWPQVIVRKSGKVPWLMNLNLVCFHYRDHSTSWLFVFQRVAPGWNLCSELSGFSMSQSSNFETRSMDSLTCDLVSGGLPTRGLTLRRLKNMRPFGPRCEPRATWWQFLVKVVQPDGGGLAWGRSTDPVGR